MFRSRDPAAYAMSVGGALILVLALVVVRSTAGTILLALLAVALLLGGWLRQRRVAAGYPRTTTRHRSRE